MKYVQLGRTGTRVSTLCFGTMSFGSYATPETAHALYGACREAGINFFDCANSYAGGGRAESLLGACMKADRDDIVITSKVCRPMSKDTNGSGLSRRHIMAEVEASLRRLDTDRIDVYFAHHYDPFTRVEETLKAFEDLRRQGKILYAGVSNWSAWRIADALGVSAAQGLVAFDVVQPMYNLVKRQAEYELFPLAEAKGLAVMIFSPLASGLLTRANADPDGARRGRLAEPRYLKRYEDRRNFEIAAEFCRIADEIGVDPAMLAVAWAASHPAVTAPIIGAETVAEMRNYLDAADFAMTPDLRARIAALAPRPDYEVERTID
ncbi:aldo/keto reductase [Prosthecomicrobium hirschii]|uniref:Aldo/keto reductase n=1 Tax=Prosthecodimorpha hirschii TaxID=665126 RepID=A0A0P6W890_9HYPH|nr:aldo/keto reductase [Prosthecomicrobium hirschii]KPL54824.1 aldo/keto reductase [Prosthecomicrobium hirschii]